MPNKSKFENNFFYDEDFEIFKLKTHHMLERKKINDKLNYYFKKSGNAQNIDDFNSKSDDSNNKSDDFNNKSDDFNKSSDSTE